MGVYNVSKIENWYDDFASCKNTFNNIFYSDFNRSYIKRCSDSVVNGFEKNLQVHYDKLKRAYANIDLYWSDYLRDLINTDIRLANKGGLIKEGTILSKINSMPYLNDYKADLELVKNFIDGKTTNLLHKLWDKTSIYISENSSLITSIFEDYSKYFNEFKDKCGAFFADNIDSLLNMIDSLKASIAIRNVLSVKEGLGLLIEDEISNNKLGNIQNRINSHHEIEETKRVLTLEINELEQLKTKMLAGNIKVDPKTGLTIEDIDKMIAEDKHRLLVLEDVIYVDGILITKKENELYQKYKAAMSEQDPLLKKKYLQELQNNYTLDEYDSIVLMYENMNMVEEFILSGTMTDYYMNSFSGYVDKDKVESTKNVNILVSEEVFNVISPSPNCAAYNNGSNSYTKLTNSPDFILPCIMHENIHQLSTGPSYGGIMINETSRGINETFTEYLNQVSLGKAYKEPQTCAYYGMTVRLKYLVDSGVLTNEDIKKAYFSNDITPIATKINAAGGSNNTYNELVMAFSKAHDSYNYDDLDKIVYNLTN